MMTTFARGKGRRYSVQRDGIESEVCKCKIAHGKGRLAGPPTRCALWRTSFPCGYSCLRSSFSLASPVGKDGLPVLRRAARYGGHPSPAGTPVCAHPFHSLRPWERTACRSSDALRAMEDILPLRVLLSALILFTRFARGKGWLAIRSSTSSSEGWWAMTDSNRRHSRCKRDALTN